MSTGRDGVIDQFEQPAVFLYIPALVQKPGNERDLVRRSSDRRTAHPQPRNAWGDHRTGPPFCADSPYDSRSRPHPIHTLVIRDPGVLCPRTG